MRIRCWRSYPVKILGSAQDWGSSVCSYDNFGYEIGCEVVLLIVCIGLCMVGFLHYLVFFVKFSFGCCVFGIVSGA